MAEFEFEDILPFVEGEGDTGRTAREKINRNFTKIKPIANVGAEMQQLRQDVSDDLEQLHDDVEEMVDKTTSLFGYYSCSTAGATAAKTVQATGYELTTGGNTRIKMEHANTYASGVTLQIGSAVAQPLYYNGAAVTDENTWEDNEVITVYYDGEKYQAVPAKSLSSAPKNTLTMTYGAASIPGTLSANGALVVSNVHKVSEFILIPKNCTLVTSGLYSKGVWFFNKDKEPTTQISGNHENDTIDYKDIPDGAVYIRYSHSTSASSPSLIIRYSNEGLNDAMNNQGIYDSYYKSLTTAIYGAAEIKGYLNADGILKTDQQTFRTSDFIIIPDDCEIVTSGLFSKGVWFYDRDKNPTTQLSDPLPNGILQREDMPEGAAYMRYCHQASASSPSLKMKYSIAQLEMAINRQNIYQLSGKGGSSETSDTYTTASIVGYLNADGTYTYRTGWFTSDYILIPIGCTIATSGLYNKGVCFYGRDKKPTTQLSGNLISGTLSYADMPEGAVYMRYSYQSSATPSLVVTYSPDGLEKADMRQRLYTLESSSVNEVVTEDYDVIYKGKYIDSSDGSEKGNGVYSASDWKNILGVILIETDKLFSIAFYDAESNYITGLALNGATMSFTKDDIPANAVYMRFSALNSNIITVKASFYKMDRDVKTLTTELETAKMQLSVVGNNFYYDSLGNPYKLRIVNGNIVPFSASYKEVVILGNSLTWHEYWGSTSPNWSGRNRSMASTTDDVSWPYLLQRILRKKEPTATVTGVMMRNWEGKAGTGGLITDQNLSPTKALLDAALTSTTDLIIFRCGENSGVHNASQYAADVLNLIDYCLTISPDANVVICGLFWPNAINDEGILNAASLRGYQYIPAGRTYSNYTEIFGDYHVDSDNVNNEVLLGTQVLTHTADHGFYLWANAVAEALGYSRYLLDELHEVKIISTLTNGYKIKDTKSPYKSLVTILVSEESLPTCTVTDADNNSITVRSHTLSDDGYNGGAYTYAFTFIQPDSDVNVTLQ